ncbi:MAG: porin [Rhodospirillales bacterium]|nr:porin [Rhodospirillales bacterium]
MKKFLLSTSAIVGVGLIAAPAGAAEKIKLGLGGYMEDYIGFVGAEDDDVGAGRDLAGFDIKTDTEVYFSGSTKLDNGISISVRIELEGDESATTVDESYASISSDTMGMIRIGGDDAVNGGAYVGPDRGISGDYDNWIMEANMTKNDNAYDSGNSGDATKVSYWSPRIAGFQLAASYVPEPGNNGGDTPNYRTDNHSAYAASLTWKETVMGVGVNSQIAMYREGTAIVGDEPGESNYNVGLRLAYQGFDVGVAYGRFIEAGGSGDVTTATDNGRTIAGSVSYKSGPWKLGVWLLDTENEGSLLTTADDETRAYSLFGEYQLSDGVLLQGLVFNVDYDEETDVDANEQSGGWGVVAGMKLSF